MPNPYGAPEISVRDVAAKVAANEQFVWLDVREPNELTAAAINDAGGRAYVVTTGTNGVQLEAAEVWDELND